MYFSGPSLSDDESALLANVERFTTAELTEQVVLGYDSRSEFPFDIWRKLEGLGVFGLTTPAEFGGVPVSRTVFAAVVEQLSRAMLTLGAVYNRVMYFGGFLAAHGSPEQRERILPKLATGECLVFVSLTEPEAGSDLRSLSTTATSCEGGVRVRGQKIFTSGADYADLLLVATRTAEGSGREMTLLLLDPASEGVTIQKIGKMGNRPHSTAIVFYDDVFVPDANIIGQPGRGWEYLKATLAEERALAAVICCGAARAALEISIEYAKTRRQFGRAIGDFQAVAHQIVEGYNHVAAARSLAYEAVNALDRKDGQGSTLPSQAKVLASSAYVRAADVAMQVLGGHGYVEESAAQMHYRDAKLWDIVAGTTEIQKSIIARDLGLRSGS